MSAELCDVCGGPVTGVDAVRAELSVDQMMCPSPMTFHTACYEKASHLWKPDTDSVCVTDPEFPETQQWTPRPQPAKERARREGSGPALARALGRCRGAASP